LSELSIILNTESTAT